MTPPFFSATKGKGSVESSAVLRGRQPVHDPWRLPSLLFLLRTLYSSPLYPTRDTNMDDMDDTTTRDSANKDRGKPSPFFQAATGVSP